MSKSKEELNKLKEEVEAVNEKLQELTPEEIAQVSGGVLRDCNEPGPVVPGAVVYKVRTAVSELPAL